LTTIKARSISGQNQDVIAVSPGFLGMADELVTFDAKHEAIFKNLLATTAIFDTVEHARDAARKVRYQVRMVTLDGTELRTGGSYAGGANRQNNSIFIKPELEQLQKEIAQEEKLQEDRSIPPPPRDNSYAPLQLGLIQRGKRTCSGTKPARHKGDRRREPKGKKSPHTRRHDTRRDFDQITDIAPPHSPSMGTFAYLCR